MKSQTTLSPSERLSPFTVVGNDVLSAWRVANGVIWVQTRTPKHAGRLAKRSDSKLVVRGVAGGYLRTFEFTGKTLAWAERLVLRYTGIQTPELTAACTGFSAPNSSHPDDLITAEGQQAQTVKPGRTQLDLQIANPTRRQRTAA
jgi:hypothetical protein